MAIILINFLELKSIGGRRLLPPKICTYSDPPPSKKAEFDIFSLIPSQP